MANNEKVFAAFLAAIREVGLDGLKQTSMFGRNDAELIKQSEKQAA